MSASLSSLSLELLSLLSSLSAGWLSLSFSFSLRDRLFHVKLAEWAWIVQLSLRVMDITAKLLDNFGRAPYPEGMRGGRVNTNIWLLGVGISLIKKEKAAQYLKTTRLLRARP